MGGAGGVGRVSTPVSVIQGDPEHALSRTIADGDNSAHIAVYGYSDAAAGIAGQSDTGSGVWAMTNSGQSAVYGEQVNGTGAGVLGVSANGPGVSGTSTANVGVLAQSTAYEAVHAETNSPSTAALAAYNQNPNGTGAAIYARKVGDVGHAGFFDGEVFVTGNITTAGDLILSNADCAEEFDVDPASNAEPGTLMVFSGDNALSESAQAYDGRVAGVVSGAGPYKPAILMDRRGPGCNRRPIALLGKVFCKVDAAYGAITVGDLLTTSPTCGHERARTGPQIQHELRAHGDSRIPHTALSPGRGYAGGYAARRLG
jgi:hypothetical protein